MSTQTKGIIYASICYLTWGTFPLYWHLLIDYPPMFILANRMLWSVVFLLIFCLIRNWKAFLKIINKKNSLYMGITGILITINWGTYIYAVNNHFVVEASLGYYINPLINVLLGIVFLKEKLNTLEKTATLLAFIGVSYFTINYGKFPMIAFVLAISLGIYGMIKKKANLPPIEALTLETLLIAPVAIIYLNYFAVNNQDIILTLSFFYVFLLVLGGIVTAIPLILFASAVNMLPLSALGFIQYISPTLQLLIGVFVFHEKFTNAHVVCFVLIWFGLLLFTISIMRKVKKVESLENKV